MRQPSLRLTLGKASAQPVSRIGGRPNLPKGIRWPEWNDAQPLSFVAQLDLAALPAVRGLPLPRKGCMFFFYDADNQPWGYDPKDRGCAQVIYSPEPLAAHPLRAPHRDLDEEARFRGFAVTVSLEMTAPGSDPFAGPAHRMGGYADKIQDDLGMQAQYVSHGFNSGHGYDKRHKARLEPGAVDWRLLLQLDSEERTGMHWGDEGRIYFMIHKDDLRRRRFDDVWLILQCT
jgi:uncharacterized protein YwqG